MIPSGLANLPIRWQALIELNPAMPPADRVQLTQALGAIEQTKAGQQLFRDLRQTQAILDGVRLLASPAPAPTDEQGMRALRLTQDVTKGRERPGKVFLTTTQKSQGDVYRFVALESGGGAALLDQVIAFDLPTLSTMVFFMTDTAGKPVTAPKPFADILMHELQHTVDSVGRMAFPPKPYSQPCFEERAVATENRFLAEAFPQAPRRLTYSDVPRSLQKILDTEPAFNHQFRHVLENPQFIRQLVRMTHDMQHMVDLNHGCAPVPAATSWQETRALLVRAGLSASNIQQLETAIPALRVPATNRAEGAAR